MLQYTIKSASNPSTFEEEMQTLQGQCKNFYYRHCGPTAAKKQEGLVTGGAKASYKTLCMLTKKLLDDATNLSLQLSPNELAINEPQRKRRRTGSSTIPPVLAASGLLDQIEPVPDRKFFSVCPPVAKAHAVEGVDLAPIHTSVVDDKCLTEFCDAQVAHLRQCSKQDKISECSSSGSLVFGPIHYVGDTLSHRTMTRMCNCCGAFILAPTSSKILLKEEESPEYLQSLGLVFACLIAGLNFN